MQTDRQTYFNVAGHQRHIGAAPSIPNAADRDWIYIYKLCEICQGRLSKVGLIGYNSPSLQKSHHLWWRKAIFEGVKSDPGRATILRHESRYKGIKHSCKIFFTYHEIRTWSVRIKIQCSKHWAKESTPWRSLIEYIRAIYTKSAKADNRRKEW